MQKYPNLVIENCASGSFRADMGILGHTHTNWFPTRAILGTLLNALGEHSLIAHPRFAITGWSAMEIQRQRLCEMQPSLAPIRRGGTTCSALQ